MVTRQRPSPCHWKRQHSTTRGKGVWVCGRLSSENNQYCQRQPISARLLARRLAIAVRIGGQTRGLVRTRTRRPQIAVLRDHKRASPHTWGRRARRGQPCAEHTYCLHGAQEPGRESMKQEESVACRHVWRRITIYASH